jgi:putative endonuclease
MFSGCITHATLKILDFLAGHTLPQRTIARHMRTGRRGEEDAYFYLRRLGYVMVARNFRSPRGRGEIDLIGWHKDVLCFIEVKTRTSHDVKPAEAAVDRDKWRQLSATAREYLRHLPHDLQWRFDVITVYYDRHSSPPQFQLFQNALPAS